MYTTMAMNFADFLRSNGAKFINVKRTANLGYAGVEFTSHKGAPSMGICFFSKALREQGIPTTDELAAHLTDYYVYDTVTESGVAGYTLGKAPAEFAVNEGVEITL